MFNPTKLHAIDEVLIKSEDTDDTDEILDSFCNSVYKAINGNTGDIITELFSDSLNFSYKKFVAICFLRLINTNPRIMENKQLSIKLFKLFDQTLSEIYEFLKIDASDQNYIKESKLKSVMINIENDFNNLVNSFKHIENILNFREPLMKRINKRPNKEILSYFLPQHLMDNLRITELFTKIDIYLNESGTSILNAYRDARETLENYMKEANDYNTLYSKKILAAVANKLLDILDAHFHNNPASKPAELTVEKFEKKYPFNITNEMMNLIFIITNISDGYAFEVFIEIVATININKTTHFIGQINPNSSIEIEVPCYVEKYEPSVLTEIILIYNNFDGSNIKKQFEFELQSQRNDINWEEYRKEQPYSLEPIVKEGDFVGRTLILDQLEAMAFSRDGVNSSFIYGQKRVGKTSIVKTLEARLVRNETEKFLVIYIEGGEYISPDPIVTVNALGDQIARKIKCSKKQFEILGVPFFNGSLSPITRFLEEVIQISPELRIIIILDEFDELPAEIYKKHPVADALFLTVRSISGKPPFGFVLVGGEKMLFILDSHGVTINKFQPIRVDYFDKQQHWAEFQNLVRKPVAELLEITDEALSSLYDLTAGNPFFTKLICRDLFNFIVKRRDCYVTHREINDTMSHTLQNVASNMFQHFWTDGIVDTGLKGDEKIILRKKIILVAAEAIRQSIQLTKDYIVQKCSDWDLFPNSVENELKEFVRRQVLIETNNVYSFKVKLFESWLVQYGYSQLITTLIDVDEYAKQKKDEERLRITSEEIIFLVKSWGIYKGKSITEDSIRYWLAQFGGNTEQRLMIKILQNLNFYTQDRMRSKLKEGHGIVKRSFVWKIKEGQRKRSDILISYLDQPGKSGSYLAKIYADENDIIVGNVIEKSKIFRELEKKADEQSDVSLVFVDDFIGTGKTVCDYLEDLLKEHGDIIKLYTEKQGKNNEKSLQIFIIGICGFEEGRLKINRFLNKFNLNIKVHICDPLDEENKAFSDNSKVFTDKNEREKAHSIVYSFGKNLVKNNPLGYGNGQAMVVFESGCPNNCLPILWQEKKDFVPLFKR